jgi:MraZ protein
MLLTGSFPRLLDDKLRFAIPKPLRDAIGHPDECVLYLAPGTDGSLALYPEDSFTRMASRLEQGSSDGRDVAAFSRLFYAQVQRIELDKQGRLRLPIELAELAGLRKEIMLLGVRDHLEIWNREAWETYLGQTQPHYDDLASRVLAGGGAPATPIIRTASGASPVEGDANVRPGQPR